jgi:hypothetical protein
MAIKPRKAEGRIVSRAEFLCGMRASEYPLKHARDFT